MCSQFGSYLCDPCATQWTLPSYRFFIASIPIYVTVPYTEEVARVVVKAKENGNKQAQNLLAKVIGKNLRQLRYTQGIENALLVPIPSSRASKRRRGEDFLLAIVERVRAESKDPHFNLEIAQLLRHNRKVVDQTGLNQSERRLNMKSAFKVDDPNNALSESKPTIIIVDDVVTTGSTIFAATSAFHEAGFTVEGAIAACASTYRFPIR